MKNLILAFLVFATTTLTAQNIYPLIAVDYHSKNDISTTGAKIGFTDGTHAGGYAFYKRATFELNTGGLFDIEYKQQTYGIGVVIHVQKIMFNAGAGVAVSNTMTQTIYNKKEFSTQSDGTFEIGLNYLISDKFAVGCNYVKNTNGLHVTLTHIIK
jgi:hypothetical protein